MLKFIVKYLQYKIFSRHAKGHGIHSPFVFQFIAEVLNKKSFDPELRDIIQWHRGMKRTKLQSGKADPGAGSRFNTNMKGIRPARIGVTEKYGTFLFRLARFCKPSQVIEFGTGGGISTAYLSAAVNPAGLITVEGDPYRLNFAISNHPEHVSEHVSYLNADFDDYTSNPLSVKKPFLVFIDGNHRFEPTWRYFEFFLSEADDDSVLVFDDIRWSPGMEEAWKKIKSHPRVRITIDIFFMGIVFFKKGIEKQDFTIKF